jgi:hypothetical protein
MVVILGSSNRMRWVLIAVIYAADPAVWLLRRCVTLGHYFFRGRGSGQTVIQFTIQQNSSGLKRKCKSVDIVIFSVLIVRIRSLPVRSYGVVLYHISIIDPTKHVCDL